MLFWIRLLFRRHVFSHSVLWYFEAGVMGFPVISQIVKRGGATCSKRKVFGARGCDFDTGSTSSLKNTQNLISEQYAKRGLGKPHFLGPIENCRCMTLVGKDFLTANLTESKPKKRKANFKIDSIFRKKNQRNKDLIMDVNSSSYQSITQPLVN